MKLVLAVTGATGAYAAKRLMDRSPWPVALIASRFGRQVYEQECGDFASLAQRASEVYENDNLGAPISSGMTSTVGMVVLPCSVNTLGSIAAGLADNLISRAAHCHLKEGRRLVLCVRETPWSLIALQNAERVASAGAVVMPMSPPFYVFAGRPAEQVSMAELLDAYVDRVLAVLGHRAGGDPAP